VHEQTQATHEEELKKKQQEFDQMTKDYNLLLQKKSSESEVEEELRTLKIAYDKMVAVKDKEIKEVEERLQETVGTTTEQHKEVIANTE
jgi:hypothetical protein